MIDVTAAIEFDGPNLRSQICAARSIGSNGNASGLVTGTTVWSIHLRVVKKFVGGTERVQRAGHDPCGKPVYRGAVILSRSAAMAKAVISSRTRVSLRLSAHPWT